MVPKGIFKEGICRVGWRGVNKVLTTWLERKDVSYEGDLLEGWLRAGDSTIISAFLEPSPSTSSIVLKGLVIVAEVLPTFAIPEGPSPTFLDAFLFLLRGSSGGACGSYS